MRRKEDEKAWKVSDEELANKLNITEWAEEDRPREKMMALGAEALTNAELLAILIGSGSQRESAVDLMKRIMRDCGDSLKTLGRMSADELKTYHGMGDAKAVTILAACELGKRRQAEEAVKKVVLDTPEKVYDYMLPKVQDLDVEESWVLLMNNAFGLKKAIRLSYGGISETAVDVRLVIKEALLEQATVLTLCHNHPSGRVLPSRDDDRLTRALNDACMIMRIHLADHVILADGAYYSYREHDKIN